MLLSGFWPPFSKNASLCLLSSSGFGVCVCDVDGGGTEAEDVPGALLLVDGLSVDSAPACRPETLIVFELNI